METELVQDGFGIAVGAKKEELVLLHGSKYTIVDKVIWEG